MEKEGDIIDHKMFTKKAPNKIEIYFAWTFIFAISSTVTKGLKLGEKKAFN